jgi:hypothetical protein
MSWTKEGRDMLERWKMEVEASCVRAVCLQTGRPAEGLGCSFFLSLAMETNSSAADDDDDGDGDGGGDGTVRCGAGQAGWRGRRGRAGGEAARRRGGEAARWGGEEARRGEGEGTRQTSRQAGDRGRERRPSRASRSLECSLAGGVAFGLDGQPAAAAAAAVAAVAAVEQRVTRKPSPSSPLRPPLQVLRDNDCEGDDSK